MSCGDYSRIRRKDGTIAALSAANIGPNRRQAKVAALSTSAGQPCRRASTHLAGVALEPLVDPLPLQTNRAAAADANVVQLAAFAGGVDGVAAHVLRTQHPR
jgi:hypothetical protein